MRNADNRPGNKNILFDLLEFLEFLLDAGRLVAKALFSVIRLFD